MKPEVLKIILSMMCVQNDISKIQKILNIVTHLKPSKKKNPTRSKPEHDEPENTADCSIKVMIFNPSGSCSFENNSSVYH